jgi:hypothetical protein
MDTDPQREETAEFLQEKTAEILFEKPHVDPVKSPPNAPLTPRTLLISLCCIYLVFVLMVGFGKTNQYIMRFISWCIYELYKLFWSIFSG